MLKTLVKFVQTLSDSCCVGLEVLHTSQMERKPYRSGSHLVGWMEKAVAPVPYLLSISQLHDFGGLRRRDPGLASDSLPGLGIRRKELTFLWHSSSRMVIPFS